MVIFLAEFNSLDLWATYIGNAYLEAETKEEVYIVVGKDFCDLEGHTLVIHKELYGLRSSNLQWHEILAGCLRDMGFFPCKVEPDIWMREKGSLYEYIDVYVDDLAISAKNPKEITVNLMKKHDFKLKGTGPIKYHLGCDLFRDETGTLCFSPRKYIEKMMDGYLTIFVVKPKSNISSPLEKGAHPTEG